MSTIANFNRDVGGAVAYAPKFGTDNYSSELTVGLEATVTVPDNYDNWIASFAYQPGTVVWVANNATATVPAGATLAATNSELNPSQKSVHKGDVIHMISPNMTAQVGIVFYAV